MDLRMILSILLGYFMINTFLSTCNNFHIIRVQITFNNSYNIVYCKYK